MINAAIVGLGRWGKIMVQSVENSPEIKFTRAVVRNPDTAAEFAGEHNLTVSASLDDALNDAALDAVVLASPHGLHFDQIMAAAKAGKHVFCEKPFTLASDEASTALAALKDAGLQVGVGYNRRFAPNVIELKRMIEAGELGTLLQIEGNYSANLPLSPEVWRANRDQSPAGGMTSLGVHTLDTFIHLMGKIDHVSCLSRRIAAEVDVDDATAVLMGFENGPIGYLGTIAATGPLATVRVFGTKGWAEIKNQDDLNYTLVDGTSDKRHWEGYPYPGMPSITAELVAFAVACDGGDPYPLPPTEIQHGVEALEAIIRAADSGERITLG